MSVRTLASRYRPQKFAEVVGQESEVEVLKKIVGGVWCPPALLFFGPYGTGKTSLARLTSKAMLCEKRQGVEPCGECTSCKQMDQESHPCYSEFDAASKMGNVEAARDLKDLLDYRASGELKIIVYDEAHMMSPAAQNALLELLETGRKGVVLMFATTETGKMLPTIRSRCIELDLKLLTAKQIADRLRGVVKSEGKNVEDLAIRVIATYVRGHLRDALMLLEQLLTMGEVTEALTRTYLRLDRNVAVYEFLVLKDKKQQFEKLEELLCSYSAQELQEVIGQTLLNAYKQKLGVGEFAEVDGAWLKKIEALHGDTLLKKAEMVLNLIADYATVNHATAVFARIFADDNVIELPQGKDDRSLMPSFRKPKAT